MEFSRQELWSGLPFPSPGDLSDSGIEPVSPALQVDSLPLNHQRSQFLWVKSLNFYTVIEYESFKGIMDSKVPYIQYFFTVRVTRTYWKNSCSYSR